MPTINGRTVSDDEFKRYWTNIFQNDPVMRQISADAIGPGFDQRQDARRADYKAGVASGAITPTMRQRLADVMPGVSNFRHGERGAEQAAADRAKALGFQAPKDWSFDFNEDNGGFRVEKDNFYTRNDDWIVPVAVGAAAGGLGLAFGGAGVAAPSLGNAVGATGSVPSSLTAGGITSLGAAPAAAGSTAALAGTAPALGGIGGAAGGSAPALGTVGGGYGATGMATAPAVAGGAGTAGTAAGLSSGSFWGKLAAGIGGDLFQGYIANRGANKAADELNKAGDKQIAAYDKALGPYMDPAPLNALKFLSGLPAGGAPVQGSTMGTAVPGQMPTTGRTAPPNVPSLGTAVPRGTLASLVPQAQRQQAQQQTASSFVRMVSPDGEEGDVHPSQVQNAIQAGARPLAMGRG